MDKVLMAVIGLVWASSLGWLFWANEVDRSQPLGLMLGVLAVFLGLTALLLYLKKGHDRMARASDRRRPSDGPEPQDRTRRRQKERASEQRDAGAGRRIHSLDIEDIGAQLHALTGIDGRADALPGWMLRLRSPYAGQGPVTSWIGGRPKRPAVLDWPRDPEGVPLTFLMQIDLADILPEPQTGVRPPGLPTEGALVVFIGMWAHHVELLDAAQMQEAVPTDPPPDLPLLRDIGFFAEQHEFPCHAVDLVPFMDEDGQRPPGLPDLFARPEGWITTKGFAAFEAGHAIKTLRQAIRLAETFEAFFKDKDMSQLPEHKRREQRHHELMAEEAPGLIAELEEFVALCGQGAPEEAVDPDALAQIMARRDALCDRMGPYAPGQHLRGGANKMLRELLWAYPEIQRDGDFGSVPKAYRPFLDLQITAWRGHRLFGLETPPPHNSEDLRGQDCLFALSEDMLLAMETEHFYGFSVWCPRDQMAAGHYGGGHLIRHSNG
ncbi:DUF1963 domain-containing protein [Antarctobacter jejuensis]|uniref:DUF1963 domain-containing protein n=1 Tax=Antarctobacter jejuensis TaxID=1439938 RepID=UPI003FD42E03